MTLDLRGHGLSARPESYTWAEFRDEIVGFIERLDLRDVLLVAHSRGGGVCLLAAAACPERVTGVVAFEPTLPGTPSLQSRIGEIVQRTLKRRSTWPSREAMYEHFRNRGAFKDWQDDFLRAYVEHGAVESEGGGIELANPVGVEALMYETMLQDEEWQKAAVSQIPVLAVYGERNARLREGFDPLATLRRYFPNASMRIQADSSHSGIMEHPDVFAETVRQFAAGR
jgi:pimeloyl-ACP methyl ester carboxylesterase